ncbi:hypothetical protein ASPWEDRAFT_185791 [Aspergillus wentii DTO 134E9]|uniref:Protein NO VEIN C-terminal domain-containing protein n=1 Tax=Aspergillus wentii DTO 134E9 TaxID=1073089 RepID=A0A1L9RER7_ASPWE|nr:uncharacterized protein ASPWEDRAFT_185791 [Aspergillus wentii DTO 134E9]OJJ33410.1 hypothetical protein ASPWEDRAFT_185791 [Aspergillus wentii DTO 134E9]
MASRESARELVKSITREQGFLGEEVLGRMDPDTRRQVEEAMLRKDEMIGSSVMTLAKNLYNSSARFVFEMLQNADDNSYTRARARSEVPFVSFRVYPRRIVVECNEDGFTYENLVAVCDVGKSSKSGAQGYIGEKGIGFKSVFMVAWKVHIQSGEFSFCFQHKMGDSGMGMISPIWQEAEDQPPGSLTRITLFLHEAGSDEILSKQRETTLRQFEDLRATFLLFMKNLGKIEVKVYDMEEVSWTIYSMEHQSESHVKLRKNTIQDGKTREVTQHFHITKETAIGLPKSENRTYTDAELSNHACSQAEIVLAFPLTPDSIPIIEAQEVFAFLPIRNMGFPFLIQSDFVTDASRQDIVRSSARNLGMLNCIAQVFVRAVSQFCQHPTLRYQWMRYLPQAKGHSWDSFWVKLVDDIRDRLKVSPVLWVKSHSQLRCITDIRRIPAEMLDRNGDPLLPDLELEQYPASEYFAKDLDLLKGRGLVAMGPNSFISRVRQDLNRGQSSMIRSQTDDDWHYRVARVLVSAWSKPERRKSITSLQLIPLIGGTWISALTMETESICYSHCNGYQIPTGLGLKLVDPQSERDPYRKQLFDLFGVEEPEVAKIRWMIICFGRVFDMSLQRSRKLLRFLYYTAHLDKSHDSPSHYTGFGLMDHLLRKNPLKPDSLFFPGNDPYSAEQLLTRVQPMGSHDGAPGTDVSILHPHYMEDGPTQPADENRTWKAWLAQSCLVRDVIPFTLCGVLSNEFVFIARHRPESFLGFLVKYWQFEGANVLENQDLVNQVLAIEVPCEKGNMYPLGKAYIPATELDYARRFLEEGEFFPWLQLDSSLCDSTWLAELGKIARALGFGYPQSELEFYLTVLRFIASANKEGGDPPVNVGRIFDIYSRIEARYHESKTPSISREMICKAFDGDCLIYIPPRDFDDACWVSPTSCVWEAPAYMRCRFPLKSLYDTVNNRRYNKELFHETLGIPNADIFDLLEELDNMGLQEYGTVDQIYNLYEEIDTRQVHMDSEEKQKVRDHFENDRLVYYGDDNGGNWYRTSECLWSSVTDIKGMVALNDQYEDLAEFFIELLGVRTLTLELVHDKLIDQGREQAPINDVKETIWLLNSYLQGEEELPSPSQILESKVFPVRHPSGSIELCSPLVDFTIIDRKHLAGWFSGKAKFLDFDLNDIPRLSPFLEWTGLEARYLSSSVKEISALSGDFYRTLTSPDRNIAQKAHGLLRIAVHFNSPRALKKEQSFYELLKKIEVCETDGITSELHLNQDGKDIKVEVSRSELHLHESEGGLRIYVPGDEESQYLCFHDRIPQALLEWMLTEPSTGICEPLTDRALNVMQSILQAQNKYVAMTLDRAGIVSVEIPDDSQNVELDAATNQINDTRSASRNSEDTLIGDTLNPATHGLSYDASDVHRITGPFRGPSRSPLVANNYTYTPQSTPGSIVLTPPQPEVDMEYRNLLYRTVNTARNTVFPTRSSFDMGTLNHSLDASISERNDIFRLRNSERIERDKKIGAAGELFVFEILSHLTPSLPQFSRDNWESTIRKYVRLHDEYTNMGSWNGRETLDITYTDHEGVLTSLLIEKNYLCPDAWTGRRPRYYLEVKSTTSSWDAPFYMSKNQYERMQTLSRGDSGAPPMDSVYIIFRVFNLGLDSMGMKIFVDPGLMRDNGELSFTAEAWSIVPGDNFREGRSTL